MQERGEHSFKDTNLPFLSLLSSDFFSFFLFSFSFLRSNLRHMFSLISRDIPSTLLENICWKKWQFHWLAWRKYSQNLKRTDSSISMTVFQSYLLLLAVCSGGKQVSWPRKCAEIYRKWRKHSGGYILPYTVYIYIYIYFSVFQLFCVARKLIIHMHDSPAQTVR